MQNPEGARGAQSLGLEQIKQADKTDGRSSGLTFVNVRDVREAHIPAMRHQTRRVVLLIAGMIVVGTPVAGMLAFRAMHYTFDPARVYFSYDDLDRFRQVYDRLPQTRDTVGLIARAYLDRGTRALHVYAAMYHVTPTAIAHDIESMPACYASLQTLAERVRAEEPAVGRALARFKALYPRAVFPPVYYLVGGGRAGGTGQPVGMLIGADRYGRDGDAGSGGCPGGEGGYHRASELPHLVTHELVHFNQIAASPLAQRFDTNLNRALTEGAADFIAMLASGDHINAAAHAYGRRHEAELWRRFQPIADSQATGDWFFVRPANGEWPQDLGYFLGYRIVEAYYDRACDKNAAVRRIMGIADSHRFLTESAYSPGAPPAAVGGCTPR